MIIAIEGVNGAGKSTQAALLQPRLADLRKRTVALMRDPGVSSGHPANEKIRPLARFAEWKNPMTRMMLYMAARCELISAVREAKYRGEDVVLDRYAGSYYAYALDAFNEAYDLLCQFEGRSCSQRMNDGQLAISEVLRACGAFTPDLTIILFVPDEVAMERWKRISGSKPDFFEQKGVQQISRLAEIYEDICAQLRSVYPFAGYKVIDVRYNAPASPEQISNIIYGLVRKELEKHDYE